jgi:hypothetical protein
MVAAAAILAFRAARLAGARDVIARRVTRDRLRGAAAGPVTVLHDDDATLARDSVLTVGRAHRLGAAFVASVARAIARDVATEEALLILSAPERAAARRRKPVPIRANERLVRRRADAAFLARLADLRLALAAHRRERRHREGRGRYREEPTRHCLPLCSSRAPHPRARPRPHASVRRPARVDTRTRPGAWRKPVRGPSFLDDRSPIAGAPGHGSCGRTRPTLRV